MQGYQQDFVSSYRDLKRWSPRAAARSAALTGLGAMQRLTGGQARALQRPRVHVLLFHHVFEDEMVAFDELVSWLERTGHVFVSYSEAIAHVVRGDIDGAYVAFSFDDGLASCRAAGEILERHGATGMFFLNGKMVGEKDPATVRAFCESRLRMPPTSFISWADAEGLLKVGHEIGDHTFSHRQLSSASPEELSEELETGRAILSHRLGPVRHFAWPYGGWSHFSVVARDAVFAAGYETCASAVRGAHVAPWGDARFCIRRDPLVAAWPLSHVAYLLARSAERAGPADNSWTPLGTES